MASKIRIDNNEVVKSGFRKVNGNGQITVGKEFANGEVNLMIFRSMGENSELYKEIDLSNLVLHKRKKIGKSGQTSIGIKYKGEELYMVVIKGQYETLDLMTN